MLSKSLFGRSAGFVPYEATAVLGWIRSLRFPSHWAPLEVLVQDAVSRNCIWDSGGAACGAGACLQIYMGNKQPDKGAQAQREMGKPRRSFAGPTLQPATLRHLNFRADAGFFCPWWLNQCVVAIHLMCNTEAAMPLLWAEL